MSDLHPACITCERLLSCWKRKPLIQTAPSVVRTVAPIICHGSRSTQCELTCRRPSSRYSRTISLYTSKALCTQRHRRALRYGRMHNFTWCKTICYKLFSLDPSTWKSDRSYSGHHNEHLIWNIFNFNTFLWDFLRQDTIILLYLCADIQTLNHSNTPAYNLIKYCKASPESWCVID